MFHFKRKDKDDKKKDKEKDKDKKKDKKERRITMEELRRLEEARRSLVGKTKKKDKLPSGITADYMESFTQAEREALASRGAFGGAGAPPRPPKRGILRGSLQDYQLVADHIDDHNVVAENTVRNEVINYERLIQRRTSGASGGSGASVPPLPPKGPPSPTPSPGGEFGFALRRSILLERTARGDSQRTVIFAEPGRGAAGAHGDTGLLPGDRLIEVNGVNVETAEREQVVALIRNSGDAVTLKVQPIPEVSELSQRQAADGTRVPVADGLDPVRRDGTLRRTGSLRFANKMRPMSSAAFRTSVGRDRRPLRRENLLELASKVVKTSDFQEGKRVSQLITLEISDEDERGNG
ncbi:disks large homolog 1-like [Pollicipes pollicipes]|uniref:disks large homolog 1-like n=1 Tax=Pollicipes pollicipes TaxID=41117 RepID=UPI0018856976|nr:disks large homolog 1-like [Pollicipes pollicipes]